MQFDELWPKKSFWAFSTIEGTQVFPTPPPRRGGESQRERLSREDQVSVPPGREEELPPLVGGDL